MRLVISVNTIFHLNALNIRVSVCYASGSKENRKEKSRPSLFVCFVSQVPPCQSRKSVRISMITGIATSPPIKVVVPLLGHHFNLRNSRLFFFNYVG